MKNKAAVQLGKLGGQVKSEAKTKTAQENGKLGGRPKKCDCECHKSESSEKCNTCTG